VRAPNETVFEGGQQETVEILPSIEDLTPGEREQGVIARVGRDRVERRLREGEPPEMKTVSVERLRADALMGATYKVAGYFTMVIAFIGLAILVGWLVTIIAGV
jgi:hypothetical protein